MGLAWYAMGGEGERRKGMKVNYIAVVCLRQNIRLLINQEVCWVVS